jgi:hypothetical protein
MAKSFFRKRGAATGPEAVANCLRDGSPKQTPILEVFYVVLLHSVD